MNVLGWKREGEGEGQGERRGGTEWKWKGEWDGRVSWKGGATRVQGLPFILYFSPWGGTVNSPFAVFSPF